MAYPPSKRLHSQLLKYPQEVIPAMDQVLKDMMLDIADMDHQATLEGMQGAEGGEEISDIMRKVYKVRPFGLPAVNMRHIVKIRINSFVSKVKSFVPHQLFYSILSRHEGGLLPLSHMFAHRAGRG